MAKRKTNVQFVKHAMEFSNYGALKQAFVMQALEKFAQDVATSGPGMPDAAFGLVSKEAWIGCAKELLAEINDHYGRG